MKALLLVVSAAVIASIVALIVIGARVFDGTVVSSPYDHGLKHDDRERSRRESGLSVLLPSRTFGVGIADLAVQVRGADGRAVVPAEVTIRLSRPSTDTMDYVHRAERGSDGSYHAKVRLPLRGRWDLKIDVTYAGRTVQFSESIDAVDRRSP